MYNSSTQVIITFVIFCSILILLLITFITIIVYRYQQKQNAYYKNLEELKIVHAHENLQSRLEMQEQTFQNISREIHDNIGQKLTLAKLHLNTMDHSDTDKSDQLISDVVNMISEAIIDLSDISRSMSSEIVLNNGLIKALEFEKKQLEKSGLYSIDFTVTGDTVFMDAERELVLFRIAQEALNNIVKHAAASSIHIRLDYNSNLLTFHISDNGRGFLTSEPKTKEGTGLNNMARRTNMLHGIYTIHSMPENGTTLKIEIPLI